MTDNQPTDQELADRVRAAALALCDVAAAATAAGLMVRVLVNVDGTRATKWEPHVEVRREIKLLTKRGRK